MRRSEFDRAVQDEFGARGDALVADLFLPELGDRTAAQALTAAWTRARSGLRCAMRRMSPPNGATAPGAWSPVDADESGRVKTGVSSNICSMTP